MLQSAPPTEGRLSRLIVVATYAVAGIAWIALSDRLLATMLPGESGAVAATVKGAAYVACTGVGLWVILLLRDRRQERGRQALAASEARYRMLAERSQDVVYRYRYGADPGFEYVSPSVIALTGYTPEEHYANPLLGHEIVVPEDLPKLMAYAGGTEDGPLVIRWRHKDGGIRWTEHRVTLVVEDGTPVAVEGSARDITAHVAAETRDALLTRAIEATPVAVAVMSGPASGFEITYANSALAAISGLSPEEVVGRSAFAFAESGGPRLTEELAGRVASGQPFTIQTSMPLPSGGSRPVSVLMSPVLDADGAVESLVTVIVDETESTGRSRAEARLRAIMDASPMATVSFDLEGIVTAWNPAAEALFGWAGWEVIGALLPYLDERGWEGTSERRAELAAGAAEPRITRSLRRRDGTSVTCSLSSGVVRDDNGEPTGYVSVVEDLTAQLAREDWNAQLRRAIDHAAEAVVITDAAGIITYVNPAFERVSGYGADELLGCNSRVLQSGLTPAKTYATMWGRLTAGETWRGVLVNRRKDGSVYEEEATLSPVLSGDGVPTAFVGVKRDLTLERRLAAGLASELNDRAAVQEAMARIEVHASLEETAASICDSVSLFDEIEEAFIIHVPAGDVPLVPIGAFVGAGTQVRVGEALPADVSAYYRERASEGPWAVNPRDASTMPLVPSLDPRTTVAAPVRYRGRTVAVLVAASDSGSPDAWIARHLRVVAELATHVAPLLGPLLESRELLGAAQREVRQVLDAQAFSPVFQAVCDLTERAPVGWEALTRFDDGVPPAVRFQRAHEAGLGDALELAAGEHATATFARLTLPGWLSVNVSPSVLLAGGVQRILDGASGPIVLELTEHVQIEDYVRLRAAIDRLSPRVMIAVDDAGAGYASLRHVLELRPDFVKLDLAFVHAIDADPARQAMVAGMVHYASETSTQLIAEGVETEAELAALRRLGVRYGQGYLLGRPSARTSRTAAG